MEHIGLIMIIANLIITVFYRWKQEYQKANHAMLWAIMLYLIEFL